MQCIGKELEKYKIKLSSVAKIHEVFNLVEENNLMSHLSETNFTKANNNRSFLHYILEYLLVAM